MVARWLLTWDWFTLLRHPLFVALVQLVVGGFGALWVAERWQRWRQRREFQHRTLVKFSDLTYEMMDRMAELLNWRGAMSGETYIARRRELLSRWTVFVSLRGEVMAGFGRKFIRSEDYQGLYKALDALRAFIAESTSVPLARFEPDQEKFLAYREAVVADMVRLMGLVSRRDWQSEVAHSRGRIHEAETKQQESVAHAASPTTGTSSHHPSL